MFIWNSAVEPFAAVTHVANDGTRTVIALALQGGVAQVATTSLPAGGRFEISFSSSVGGRMVVMTR